MNIKNALFGAALFAAVSFNSPVVAQTRLASGATTATGSPVVTTQTAIAPTTSTTVSPNLSTSNPALTGPGSPFTGQSLVTGGTTSTVNTNTGTPVVQNTNPSLANENLGTANGVVTQGTGIAAAPSETLVTAGTSVGTTSNPIVLDLLSTSGGANTGTVSTAPATAANTISAVNLSGNALVGFFNTVVNTFNFLELVNVTNDPVNGSFVAIDFDGNSFVESFTLPAQRRRDFDIHSLVGQGRFGHIFVDWTGASNAVFGAIGQYGGTANTLVFRCEVPLERVSR